jgi:hypothetical protein
MKTANLAWYLYFVLLALPVTAQETSVVIPFETGSIMIPVRTEITLRSKAGFEIKGKVLQYAQNQLTVQTKDGTFDVPLEAVEYYDVRLSNRPNGRRLWFTDPAASRGLFAPTGAIPHHGKVVYENYNGFLHTVSAGVLNRVSLSVGMTTKGFGRANFFEEQNYTAGIKGSILNEWWARFAVGSQFVKRSWSPDKEPNKQTMIYALYGIGDPNSLEVHFLAGQFYFGNPRPQQHLAFSSSLRIFENVKFLFEIDRPDRQNEPDYRDVYYAYGIRLMTRSVSADLGLYVKHKNEGPGIAGMPLIKLTFAP